MGVGFAAFLIVAIRVVVIGYLLFLATRLVNAVEKIAERVRTPTVE
jgi:large-conductance mechanosensitive channel